MSPEVLEFLAPVLFAAIVVFGVVGGVLAQTFMTKVVPALQTLARERTQLSSREVAELRETVGEMRERIARLEDEAGALDRVRQDVEFLQRLLEERAVSTRETARGP
jgi:hypothetical protein